MIRSTAIIIFLTLVFAVSLSAQSSSDWATNIGSHYWVQPDVVYNTANNTPLKLDVWYRYEQTEDQPTLVYFHGGGLIFGAKTY